jgi:hypothetical protein
VKIWICASIPDMQEIELAGGHVGSYQEKFDPRIKLNLVGNIHESDLVLVPHDAKFFSKNTSYLKYLSKISEKKPILISDRGDFPTKISLKNSTLLRVGIEPAENFCDTIILPYNIKSISHLSFRDYGLKPEVSFVGQIPNLSLGRAIKSFNKSPFHPIKTNAAIVRRLAIKKVKSSTISSKVLIRNSYGGLEKHVTNPHIKREEFVKSILESDFVLCPRGDSNGSLRFYETLSAGRIPLIPNTQMIFPKIPVFDSNKHVISFNFFSGNLTEEVMNFWTELDAVKYHELQSDLRAIFDQHFKFDIFVQNLLNFDFQHFAKFKSFC